MEQAKILVVDDVRLTLEMARSLLKDTGCKVITASSGREAMETAKRERPHLVITDLIMPDMNGDEYCRKIKQDPHLSHIPVILASSRARLENHDGWDEGLFEDTLHKPFAKGEFLDTVQKYVEIKCRKHERYPVDVEVFYKCGDKATPGKMVNISRGGICVQGSQFFPRGSSIDIAVIHKRLGCFELFGKVAWSENNARDEGAERSVALGIAFTGENLNLEETVDVLSGRSRSGRA